MNQNHDKKERSVVNKMSTHIKKKKNVLFIYVCKRKMCIKGFCVFKRCVKRNSCVCEQRVYIKKRKAFSQIAMGVYFCEYKNETKRKKQERPQRSTCYD